MAQQRQPRFSVLARGSLLAGICLAAISQPAMAQGGPAIQDQSGSTAPQSGATSQAGTAPQQGATQAGEQGLQDIVVTARYVRENLQKAPVSISAATGDQLKSANISNVQNLGALVPNLYTHPGDADEASSPTVVMRGVVQNDASYARAPAVALYVDDIYHPTVVGTGLDLTDIDRVEIDRGPQSTLSGNASIGGAIKIYTKDPVGDNSGFASLGYGTRNLVTASAAIDLGLTDTLAIRASGHLKRQDGFVKLLDFTCEMQKLGTPQLAGSFPTRQPDVSAHGCKTGELGGLDQAGGQIKLRWKPTDKLQVNLLANIERERDQETPEVVLTTDNPGAAPSALVVGYNQIIQAQYGFIYDQRFLPPKGERYSSYSTYCRPKLNNTTIPSDICFSDHRKQNSSTYAARVNYAFEDNLHLTAIGSYAVYSNAYTQNGDGSPLGYILSHFAQRVKAKTGEVRLDTQLFDDKLNLVVGGFAMGFKAHSDGFIGYLALNFPEYDTADVSSESGFFHLDYKLTDRWRVSGGARYTHGKLSYVLNHPGLLVVPAPFGSVEKRWDWLLSTDYQITDDVLAYASAATGSRPPGVTTIVNTAQQVGPTPLEEMISYELGLKTSFFDHRLRANFAAFYEDYKSLSTVAIGVQCFAELPGATWYPSFASCASKYPNNTSYVPWYLPVGEPASVKGFEWDITAAPVPELLVQFSGGYNRFKSGVDAGSPGYLFPGNHLQPSWNLHANVSYDVHSSFGVFTPRVDWAWQSQQDFDPAPGIEAPQAQYIIRPYSMFNAQLVYKTDDDKWSAVLAVGNVTNHFTKYQIFNDTFGTTSPVGPPREYSLTVRRSF